MPPRPTLLRFRLILAVGGGLDIRECGDEVTKDFRRHHDGVPVAANVLGDLDDHATVVLLQI